MRNTRDEEWPLCFSQDEVARQQEPCRKARGTLLWLPQGTGDCLDTGIIRLQREETQSTERTGVEDEGRGTDREQKDAWSRCPPLYTYLKGKGQPVPPLTSHWWGPSSSVGT